MPSRKERTLRLILGDQLNYQHSWFRQSNDAVTYLIMEMKQETNYVMHHAQKLIGFFAAMYNFAAYLRKQGHQVIHLTINDPENRQDLCDNITYFVEREQATAFEYQLPDEYRLDQQLKSLSKKLSIPVTATDTEHFFTHRYEMGEAKKFPIMETFYRQMRKKHVVLMQANGDPLGDTWNFDKENREPIKKGIPMPAPLLFQHDYSSIWQEIEKAGVKHFGNPRETAFEWPTSRRQSLQVMAYFMDHLLPLFGRFQDAMQKEHAYLYHSRLSFALNTKMLSPAEVVKAAEQQWHAGKAPLPAVEGFIRQILGWREFMRGIYWHYMPDYATRNHFNHQRALPGWFWTGKTGMSCLQHTITQSLDTAYAHHIQRLMVTGNFALLAGISPDALDEWYLGIYIDAIEWVEITNTRGMSQYADGGIAGTKPYVSSGAYIHKMSNYCVGCKYRPDVKTGKGSCPFNSLYWHFFHQHRDLLERNPRIGMAYRTWDKMDAGKREQTLQQAKYYLENIEEL